MMNLFSSVCQIFGLLGLFKFLFDQATMNVIRHMMIILHQVVHTQTSSLPDPEKKRLLTDVSTKLWDQTLGHPVDPNASYGVFSSMVRVYQLFVPEIVRWVITYPGAALAIPYRWLTGAAEKDAQALRRQTRDYAIQGLWSFIIPAALGFLSAYLLVREVEYVQVYGEHDGEVEDAQGRVVKRIMIGGGRFSFSIPHNSVILIGSQIVVGLTVFHMVGLLLFLVSYQPASRPRA